MFDEIKDYDYIEELNQSNPRVRFQLGLKIASMNVRGLVHYHTQRLALYIWMVKNDIDVMLIQEWYVHHKHGERRLDMTLFKGYRLIDNDKNTKTLILYKTQLAIDDFSYLNCKEDGIDITWISVKTKKSIMAIASFYHRPGEDADKLKYDCIYNHFNIIKHKYNHTNIGFFIGGDFNGKNINWGSTISDERGKYIIDWIVANGLDFINDGTKTYVNSTTNKEDALDLSLISTEFLRSVINWNVKKDIYYILKDKNTNKNKKKKNDNNFLQHQNQQNDYRIKLSDHYALVTNLHFDPICHETPSNLAWNLKTSKIKEYKCVLKEFMKEWKESYEIL